MTTSRGVWKASLKEMERKISASSELERAYAAGLFDGEGCIAVYQYMTAAGFWQVRFSLNVANTDPRVLEWLVDHFAGKITDNKGRGANKRPCFTWYLMNKRAELFLKAIRPFLIIKADQVDLAMEFRATYGKPGVTMSEDVLANRKRLLAGIKSLKRVVIPLRAVT